MPRVSVLLTCYNHLSYLEAAIDGLLAQSFQDFELIALDDGSTDGTREWLSDRLGPKAPKPNKWEPLENRTKLVFNESNLGTYGTLNVGLAHVSGDFVAVLNDDDVWLPTKLERQVELMDAHPNVGLVHTGGEFIDAQGNRTEGSPLGFAFPKFEAGDLLLRLIYSNTIIASAVLARKRCFDELGPFDASYFGSGDWEMWLRIAERWELGFVDEPLTLYRIHGQNASHNLERIWLDDEKLRTRIAQHAPEYATRGYDPAVLNHALAHNWACLGTVSMLNGKRGEARRAYAESLRLRPGRWKSVLRLLATFLPKGAFRKTLRAGNRF